MRFRTASFRGVAVNRTERRPEGTFRRRLMAGAMAAAAVSATGFPNRPAYGQSIGVSGGAVQSNSTPTTYVSIEVYGTDGSSNPSTYNADATLTLTGNLQAHDLGVFNVNANVTEAGYGIATSGGRLRLNAGRLTSRGLSLTGLNAVSQGGGSFTTTDLYLNTGATLTYGVNDTIDGGYVYVTDGAILTLGRNLVANTLVLQSGGSIARTSETISASRLIVDNSALDLVSGDSFSGYYSSSVGNGGVVNAAAGTSLGTLIVSGVNGSSAPSTFNVNGDVTVNGYLQSYSDGVINLNAGTVTAAQGLYFDGVGSVTQTAGHYSTNSLSLSNGAALGYGVGDAITDSVGLASGAALTLAKDLSITGGLTVDGASTSFVAAGHNYAASQLSLTNGAALTYGVGDAITSSVNVSGGSTLTLDQNLTLTGNLNLSSGGSISRTTETISAQYFNVTNAALDLLAGDTFSPYYFSNVQSGGVVNAPAGTSLGYLSIAGTNGVGDHARFNVNGDVTLAGYAQAYSGGIINLNAGTVTAAQGLYFDGVGSVTQTAGHYSTNSLSLSNGAALGYGVGDAITDSVGLASGAALTLAKDLSITGGLTVDGASTSFVAAGHNYAASQLSLTNGAALTYGVGDAITSSVNVSGGSTLTLDQNLTLTGNLNLSSGGSISRTTETISAQYFNVTNAALDLLAGDTFSPYYFSNVQSGGVVNAPAGTSLGYLSIAGTNGVGDHARFNVNGDVTLAGYAQAYSGGIINLSLGTFSAQTLYLDGVGSANQAGGHYATTSLNLSSGVSVAFLAGDSVDRLSVDGAGSVFDEQSPLTLLSMALTNSGVLHLNAFTGSGAVSNWALRLNGNDQSILETLIAGGYITGAVSPLVVTYDAGSDTTYVSIAAVPEPSTYAMAFVGLACGGWHMVRRRRARSCARSE